MLFVLSAISLFYLRSSKSVQMKLAGLDPNKKYICQTFNGRLANHIYQYASIYGIATLNNLTIILAHDDDLVQYFEVPSAVKIKSRTVCDSFVKLNAEHCCVFEPSFMKLEPNENYKIGVYLQSWKYFAHAQDNVRKELTFRKPIRDFAIQTVETFRRNHTDVGGIASQETVVVGVHVRRGDLASEAFIKTDAVLLAPDEYIRNAVDFYLDRFENVIFLVCSDGMEYAKEIMKYRNVTTKFVHTTPIQDLAILASCDHVLTTVASFGWWAGFLSKGIVTYYKYPMREGTFERREYNYDDFFLPHWIGLG